jgi:radical SAM protein with 4Fe4S-binding SPASM domain
MHTNGVHLTDPQRLKDAGLTNLVISLNSVNAQQHERIMGIKGQFDNVCANIERARAIPGWSVVPRAVYSQDRFTERDMEEFHRRWGWKWGSEAITVYETNWIGLNRTQRLPKDENIGCLRALSQIYVAFNGDLHMCCMDALGKIVFGNVRDNTIREVYNSEKYVEFRRAHAEDRALDVPECRGCTRC